ncbi:MAG: hypothetical protein R3320_01620 [Nitriliruptorales bacterium]|nr:hypothetical protein [Nitriliruptorales bacterium]
MSADTPAVERVHPPDWLMKIINPLTRFLLKCGKPDAMAERVGLLRFRGRRTGRRFELPAGVRRVRGRLATLTNSSWRFNFRDGHELELFHRGEWHEARGTLLEDPDEVAAIYEDLIAHVGYEDAPRQLGIRINVDRTPTRQELRAMAERSGLSVLWYDLGDDTEGA